MVGNLPKRALIAITSYNGEFYDGGKKTGLYWSEALHPYNVFKEAGIDVDVAAENPETFGYDEHSIAEDALDPESKEGWNAPSPLRNLLEKQLQVASKVDPSKYGIFFAAGGHGAIYDYPSAKALQNLAAQIYASGGVVGAVCHGPAILPGILDTSSGKPIIAGKKVTGFAKKGEEQFGVLDRMRKENVKTVEEGVVAVGGNYIEPPDALGDFTQTDGRIATGVNPASAKSTAENTVKVFQSL